MCSAFFWHYSDESLFEVCCVDKATNARKGIKLVIECDTEENVLDAHMEVIARMAPELTGAFNGGNFDWPLYREKLRRTGKLTQLKSKFSSLPPIRSGKYADTEESVLKWNFRGENVKIDAETKHSLDCVADFPGMLDTDVLPVFLKLYPRAEVRKSASLNFFLAKNGLESKEDMPYKRMFKIYERAVKLSSMKSCHCGTAQHHCGVCKEKEKLIDCKPIGESKTMDGIEYSDEIHDDLTHNVDGKICEKCCYCGKRERNLKDMADVGYYCVIDCVRPQQLYVKRTIIPDKRELSNMSYVSLYDSFYRADGMKVRNVIGAYCHKRDIAFSNAKTDKSDTDKDHYPGAWVFVPNRGLHSDGWIDVVIVHPDGRKELKRVRCRPITGLDFASLYPSLMMAYNLSPDRVVYCKETAEELMREGYNLHHVKPFEFERGAKKGGAGNQRLTTEGWMVRHNGVFNSKKEITIVD
jgi:DNA polymerase elongation subunit (family B)